LGEGVSLPAESHQRSSACICGWPKACSCSSHDLHLRLAEGLQLQLPLPWPLLFARLHLRPQSMSWWL
jgi:hypothetical protein